MKRKVTFKGMKNINVSSFGMVLYYNLCSFWYRLKPFLGNYYRLIKLYCKTLDILILVSYRCLPFIYFPNIMHYFNNITL